MLKVMMGNIKKVEMQTTKDSKLMAIITIDSTEIYIFPDLYFKCHTYLVKGNLVVVETDYSIDKHSYIAKSIRHIVNHSDIDSF